MTKINLCALFLCGLCFLKTNGQQPQTETQKVDTLETEMMKEIKLSEVILTAPQKIKIKPIGSVKVDQVQLAREMTADVRDLVRYMPGIGISYASSRGGTRGFAIRGVEANRVAIRIDGIKQPEIHENLVFSAYGLSNAARIEFEPYFVSAIDIQKGASSFAIGSGALGGAVNYRTKTTNDLISEERDYGIDFRTSYNGKDNLKMYLLGAAAKYKKWEGLLMFSDRYGEQLMESKETYYGIIRNALELPSNAQDTDIGQAIIDFFEKHKGMVSEHQVLKIDGVSLCLRVEDVETHSLFVRTDNATYGHGARRIVVNLISVADYMYNALSKIPRSIKDQKELALDHGHHIIANQKILDLDFDKLDELKEMETRMEQINEELDKKFDVDVSKEEPEKTQVSAPHSQNVGVDRSL